MFELFFKYPASLFEKGHFVFLTPWPLWLLAVGIAAAAGLLLWHVRRNHGMLTGARPIAIWLLETAMVVLLLFLLWEAGARLFGVREYVLPPRQAGSSIMPGKVNPIIPELVGM